MSRSTIFSPFSQKYLLRKRHLHDKTDGAIRLVIHCDLNWHWGVRNDKLFVEIWQDFQKLVAEHIELYSTDSTCVVENQSFWNMGECLSNLGHRAEKSPSVDVIDKSKCSNWRMEHLAYFSPAHINTPENYGIHLTKRGIAKLAQQVHQLCPDEPLEIVQMAAVYKLFAHEMCHAWIEDICSLIDFSEGATEPNNARRYAVIQQRYNGYIFMEEAICNTAAYGWLREFLFCSPKNDDPLPPFNPQKILDAFEQWMRQQPKGYRDFLAIKEPPHQSELFIQNICRLLVEIYGVGRAGSARQWHDACLHELADAIGVFFAGHLTPDCRHFHSRDANRRDTLWAGEPPLHVEE